VKKLPIEKIMEEMETLGFRVNPDFLKSERVESPILKQVAILMESVGEKGLKLTTKGNLPTAVVKQIAFCDPLPREEFFLQFTKRFIEDEQVSAQRCRAAAEVGKLVKKVKGKLLPGSMAEAYREASEGEKFLYLLWNYGYVNLDYFDRMQESGLVDGLAYAMLQVLRDKPAMYREVKAYNAFLIDMLPDIYDRIEDEILPETIFDNDPLDAFDRLVHVRLFGNFFAPFGLVGERGTGIQETYECIKNPLLDELLQPMLEVNAAAVLDKKKIREFDRRAKNEKIGMDLFEDLSFLFAQGARYPLENPEKLADKIVKLKRVIGTAASIQKAYYTDLAYSTNQTISYFTQLEVKGGGSRADEMESAFISFIDGFYALLPSDKPYNMINKMQIAPFFLLDMMNDVFEVDTMSPNFLELCEKKFSEEAAEDIGTAIFLMSELEKRGRKLKRVNAKMQAMTKEALTAFILAIMSIHSEMMDGNYTEE